MILFFRGKKLLKWKKLFKNEINSQNKVYVEKFFGY